VGISTRDFFIYLYQAKKKVSCGNRHDWQKIRFELLRDDVVEMTIWDMETVIHTDSSLFHFGAFQLPVTHYTYISHDIQSYC